MHPRGETVCVPFLVTNKGYGIVWDNPSQTLVSAGIHGHTSWKSNVGERVSFFIIVGNTTDDLYAGYRPSDRGHSPATEGRFRLHPEQGTLRISTAGIGTAWPTATARARYPLDVMVVDWFYWTRMGQLDIDPIAFPIRRA